MPDSDPMREWMAERTAEINGTPLEQTMFMELVNLSLEFLGAKRRAMPPDPERCLEDMKGGFYLTDIPENQMGMGIMRECRTRFGKDDGERIAQSFLHRWFAFMKAKDDGVLAPFIRQEGNGEISINDAVWRAAASSTIGDDGHFIPGPYVELIRKIIAEEESGG